MSGSKDNSEGLQCKVLLLVSPGKAVVGILATTLVLGLGVWVGLALRRKRLGTYRSPYESKKFRRPLPDAGGYEAVGI